jgi:hypothetical protein
MRIYHRSIAQLRLWVLFRSLRAAVSTGMLIFVASFVFLVSFQSTCFSQGSLAICSFNIQFLGNSKVRDNAGLAALLEKYDIVVVQELIAPPLAGKFPNGERYNPNPKAELFFDCMRQDGFGFWLSEVDTGPGLRIHLNSSATEWWVAFYRTNRVKIASDLPSGFLSPIRAHNEDFDRVPYAFAFRTLDNHLDFVLISVHLEPGAGRLNRHRRKHELAAISSWISLHQQKEKDFIVLGDMSIENSAELVDATPFGFYSLNEKCDPTHTNVRRPKPYDHVMYRNVCTGRRIDGEYGFHVEDLVASMRSRWSSISSKEYPGGPVYHHNEFRKYYSDHDPVSFKIFALPAGNGN